MHARLIYIYFKIDLFYVYERFPAHACSAPRGQERVLDPLELDLQWLAACRHLNLDPGPLQEKLAFLTSEPSLQPTQPPFPDYSTNDL